MIDWETKLSLSRAKVLRQRFILFKLMADNWVKSIIDQYWWQSGWHRVGWNFKNIFVHRNFDYGHCLGRKLSILQNWSTLLLSLFIVLIIRQSIKFNSILVDRTGNKFTTHYQSCVGFECWLLIYIFAFLFALFMQHFSSWALQVQTIPCPCTRRIRLRLKRIDKIWFEKSLFPLLNGLTDLKLLRPSWPSFDPNAEIELNWQMININGRKKRV